MLRYKKFENYDAYVRKQGGKITYKLDQIISVSADRIEGFRKNFVKYKKFMRDGSVLCLGARTGCEIVGAELAGFSSKSTGIDLHPVGDNVVYGDFHNIPFPDNCFDNCFTNSIDHCWDLSALIKETKRVMVADGVLFFMVMHKQCLKNYDGKAMRDRMATRAYDSLFWDTEEELICEFINGGYSLIHDDSDSKWRYVFLKNES